ncbi:MAG: sodium-dependent transporter, partial [Candidatus Bilamarchaeaceae archaeon]
MSRKASAQTWSSHWIFILACIGSAVGLGNIWRLPYTAGMNGGGNFLLPYVLAVLFVGAPALIIELTVGKTIRENAVGAFKKMLSKKWWLVLFPLGLSLLVFSYYLVITGWTMFYAASSLFGLYIPFAEASGTWWLALGALISIILVELVSRLNIKDGLEKVNLYLLPVLLLTLLALFINSFSLSGFSEAISFMTTFDLASLTPLTITAAISQAIFSLSIGFTAMLTYGSYARKKEELFKSSLIIVTTDTLVGIISAFIVFTVAFTFSIPLASGPELAFASLPHTFLSLPYGGIAMSLFFLMLLSAAMTSAVSLSEVLVDNLRERGEPRQKASIIMLALTSILFVPSALSYSPLPVKIMGIPVLDFLDAEIVGRFAAPIVVASIIAFTWGWKDCRKALAQNVPAIFVDPIYFMV